MAIHDTDDDVARDFAKFVEGFGYGELNERLTERLRDVVKACRNAGSKGSLTIKFAIEAKGDMVAVTAAVKTSVPEPVIPGHSFWGTEDGALTTNNPKQLKLPVAKMIDQKPIKVVPGPYANTPKDDGGKDGAS